LVAGISRFVAFWKLRAACGAYGRVLQRVFLLLALLLVVAESLASSSLGHARRAQALLGAGVWTRIIAIENAAGGARYAAVVHALVFEFDGILWFYTDADGTQSFSLHRGNLAAEQADFAPLLREIEPGFRRWSVVPDTAAPEPETAAAAEPLLNGCFIESVAAWRRRVARGEETGAPRLLSYYYEPGAAKAGHTVLAFEERDRIRIFDPARPEAWLAFPKRAGRDALALAQSLDGRQVRRARFLTLPALPASAVARGATEAGPAQAVM
jgi:hypothetical protein